MRFIVTGGMGFFGSVLMDYLLTSGHEVLSLDRLIDPQLADRFRHVQVDIEDRDSLKGAVKSFGPVDAIFHVAAVLAHDKSSFSRMWSSNVEGTGNVMEVARELGIGRVVFTSSNCVFAASFPQPINESAPTSPIEPYGHSKLEAEKVIASYSADVSGVSIRCPTIIGAGRLGLLSILFDFVREGRRIYLLGDGSNRYSFIYAEDLARACLLAVTSSASGIYHIGSSNVPTMRQLYTDLYDFAGKPARLVCLPEAPAVVALKLLNRLGLSPLGPYHYRMLAANVVFDTSKIQRDLGWTPRKTNSDMLCEAYKFYLEHLGQEGDTDCTSPHRRPARAGIFNLLRLIS